MIVKLLPEHHLELLSLKGVCRGSSESTLVMISNSWKSYAAAQFCKFGTYLTCANVPINAHAAVSGRATGLMFGMRLHPHK